MPSRTTRALGPSLSGRSTGVVARRYEAQANKIFEDSGNIGKDLRRKDKTLITITKDRRTFQDSITRWNEILSDHLGLAHHLEKDVPGQDVRQSRNRTLHDHGLRVASTRGEAAELYGEIRPEHFHMPTCRKANAHSLNKNKLTSAFAMIHSGP